MPTKTPKTERLQARVKPGFREEIQRLAAAEKREEADMVRILLEEALTARASAVTGRRR